MTTLAAALLLVAGPGAALTGDEYDLGARALHEDGWSTPVLGPDDQTRSGPVFPQTPPLRNLYGAEPTYYLDRCHVRPAGTAVLEGCVYGDPDGQVQVAMVGDSKIGRLFPALEEVAHREGWALRTYTKSACAFVDEPTDGYPACDSYNAALREHLAADPPDLVLTGAKRRDVADGYVRTWRWLRGIGVERVVATWDSPVPVEHPAECVADALEQGLDLTTCATELPDEVSGNPSMRAAAEAVDGADFVDLRDWVCPQSALSPLCAPVIGRAQVYGLSSHLATPYGATLTDPMHQRLHEIGVAAYRPSVDRVFGRDRYATAAELSRGVAPGGRVFVASGLDHPDALAAAAQAGADAGAVLLTRPASVPAATLQALLRLRPEEIVVVGGPARVEEDVVTLLEGYAPVVRRVWGEDRYGTAELLAQLDPVVPGGTVFVATGTGFADALAAAAQAGQQDSPILLVRPDRVPEATVRALQALGPRTIVVVGGTVVVSEAVEQELGSYAGEVDRRGGANRWETAEQLARSATDGSVIHVSVGTEFPDALAAAPVAAAVGGAVLLVAPDRVPAATARSLTELAPARAVLTGGPAAVDLEVHRGLVRLVR